ncbi:NADH dehydrogenase [ubiquinone] 1 alpha subcomplex subunit 2-like [Liolophura sinensis]|uniref:NADH dehydrogenase [ubiquinone] 1 alpha subcomplex subunit 2-like n=1 Tax=Liolophura sinensis TaxID=3198878 RepID=UPI003159421A
MAASALRFGQHLKELRIHLCQKSAASKGVRDFLERHYVPVKKSNPQVPILVRECSEVQPKMYARYEYGRETSVPLTNLSADDVLNSMKILSEST